MFAGGFELDAAQAVCAGDGLEAEEIPGLVGSLVEKSVLKRRHGEAADRFRLLEPLRQFGRERLRQAGADQALRARHRDWIGDLAAAVGADDARQVELFRRVRVERANVWAAIDFCLDDPAEAERGVTICSDLWVYWSAQGPISDIRRVFAALLPMIPGRTRSHARALLTAGVFAFVQNDYTLAGQMFAEAATIGRETRDADVVARSVAFLSSTGWVEGRPADAAAFADESLNLARSMHLPGATLRALTSRGYAYLGQGDFDAAIAIAGEGVHLSEELGETWERGILFQLLAGASLGRGDTDDAANYAQRSAALEHDLDDRVGLAHTIALLASIEMARKSATRAATLLGASEAIFQSIPSSLMKPFEDARKRAVDDSRDGLGEAAYLTAYAAGLDMTRDEVVAYAVEARGPAARPVATPVSNGRCRGARWKWPSSWPMDPPMRKWRRACSSRSEPSRVTWRASSTSLASTLGCRSLAG